MTLPSRRNTTMLAYYCLGNALSRSLSLHRKSPTRNQFLVYDSMQLPLLADYVINHRHLRYKLFYCHY